MIVNSWNFLGSVMMICSVAVSLVTIAQCPKAGSNGWIASGTWQLLAIRWVQLHYFTEKLFELSELKLKRLCRCEIFMKPLFHPDHLFFLTFEIIQGKINIKIWSFHECHFFYQFKILAKDAHLGSSADWYVVQYPGWCARRFQESSEGEKMRFNFLMKLFQLVPFIS